MNGPILIKIFTCKDCMYLKDSALGYNSKKPYTCYHDNIVMQKNGTQLMLGNIGSDKITP